ncbi:MAG: ABC transporter permease [Alphaproteobacteria bacterium]|nr:ABC transporter permease [Alphaproteobacteria bacterium]
MRTWHAVLFLLPVSVLMAAIFLVPLGQIAYTSVDGPAFSARAYAELASSTLFNRVLFNTFEISVGSMLVCLLVGYPIAYHLSRVSPRRRSIYLILVLLPFWTSILVKSFAFTVILGENGIINNALRGVLGPNAALPLLFNRVGVTIGMVHYLLPFMVFPVLVSLLSQNGDIHRAARIMGASRARIFFRITLPLSLPGVLAGAVMTLVLSLGMFVTPALLGGRRDLMMANLVDFYTRVSLDWGIASSIALLLLGITGGLIAIMARLPGEHRLV